MSRLLAPLFSTVIVLAGSSVLRAADDDPKVILQKAIKAHGGEEFLLKHQAVRASNKGKINIPGVGEAEFTQDMAYMLPDKLKDKLDLSIGGQNISIVTVMNGDKLSIEAAGKAVDITDDIRKAMKDAQYMMSIARLAPLLKDKSYEISLFGAAKVEEKPAIGVRVTAKGQKDITLFCDAKTGLLAKLEQRTVEAGTGAEINEERIILEYKK